MEQQLTDVISITDSAAAELIKQMKESNIPEEKSLRLGVKGGGCSGLTYILDFDKKSAFDEEIIMKGVKVLVDKRHLMYLMGMQLDYQFGLNDRGFIFNNPNAESTCGCGTSFST